MPCGSCKWFKPLNPQAGQCHALPPTVLLMPKPGIAVNGQMDIVPGSFWPAVPAAGECSLFKPDLAKAN